MPGAEISGDCHIGNSGLFLQLAQCSSTGVLARLDATLDQLQSGLWMFEGQNLLKRGIAKHHGACLVCKVHGIFSLIVLHLSNFFAKVMPAWAGLVDGMDT